MTELSWEELSTLKTMVEQPEMIVNDTFIMTEDRIKAIQDAIKVCSEIIERKEIARELLDRMHRIEDLGFRGAANMYHTIFKEGVGVFDGLVTFYSVDMAKDSEEEK